MASEKEIEDIINLLDGKAESGVSRICLNTSENVEEGDVKEVHHHGRCNVGSAWANGTVTNTECIDIPELKDEED